MTLLFLAVAYILGISLGKWVWDYGLLPCDLPPWFWWVPFSFLLLAPMLRRWEVAGEEDPALTLRWPTSAGFEPPRPSVTLTLCVGMLLCLLIGVLRYAAQPLTPCWTPTDLAYYNLPASQAFNRGAARLTLEGYISAYPAQEDGRYQLTIVAEKIVLGDMARPVHGTMLVRSYDHRPYRYGTAVRVSGRLVTPPDFEDFSYREYLARTGVHSVLYDAEVEQLTTPPRGARFYRLLYAVRARAQNILNQSLPEPYAALASGILLGIDSGIPEDLYEQFNLAGISHLLVISGSNVALIVAVALALSQRLVGRKPAVYLVLTAIGLYALLVGAEAAVLRAAWMGGLVVFAGAINRRSTALISLAAAICLMLFNPLILWDVGFQLSSMATAGLILFIPPITQWVSRIVPGFQGGFLTSTHATPTNLGDRDAPSGRASGFWYALITDSLIVTLAANVMVLPLLVYYFGRVSVISLVANLLVSAVQPMILLSGTFGLVIGLIGLAIVSKIFLWVAWLGLYWTTLVAQWAAHLPGASLEVARFGWGGLIASYALIFAVRFGKLRMIGHYLRQAWPIDMRWSGRLQPLLVSGLLLLTILVWHAVTTLPDGKLHIYFLNVDGGSGTLIQTPTGHQILVNGGPISQRLMSELGEIMPFWDRTLDIIVATQTGGRSADVLAEIARRLHVDQLLVPQTLNTEQWHASLASVDIPVSALSGGEWIDLGDGVALWVLRFPYTDDLTDDRSNEHLMIRIVYGGFSFLLSGDNISRDMHSLVESGTLMPSILLQIAASQNNAAYDELLANVNPQLTIVHGDMGLQNFTPAEHAIPQNLNKDFLQTAQVGRIHIYTDGQQWWLETSGNQ
jgi:competence protein ComEC